MSESKVVEMKRPPEVEINGITYELSTKLRVAYKVQGQNAHKPYSEIFSQLDGMPIEKQIDILYAAFEVANPEAAKSVVSRQVFLDWYLDNYDVSTIMDQLQDVIGGILGQDLKEKAAEKAKEKAEETEGN